MAAIGATAAFSAFVADAQPGRAATKASDTTTVDDGSNSAVGDAAVATLPPTTSAPGVPRAATTPATPAPARPRRRRQTPVTTTSGS